MTGVEIGLGLQGDKHPGSFARLARLAEDHGFDVVSVFGDLMYQPPIGPLLEIAAATTRVRLGPACFNPFSMAPYEIAGQLAYLDGASGGRAYLGLARGTWLGAVGLPQPRPLATLEECAAVVAHLLRGDPAGYSGSVFSLSPGTTLRYPVARGRIPLLIGAWGAQALALAGRIADEVKVGGSANPAMIAVVRERIAVGTHAAGRSVDDVRITLGAVTVVDRDGTAARQRARSEVAMYLAVVADLDPTVDLPDGLVDEVARLVDAGDDVGAGGLIDDDVLDRFAFSGDPDQVAAQAQSLIDAGVGRVEFGTPHGLSDESGVTLLGSAVLPQLYR